MRGSRASIVESNSVAVRSFSIALPFREQKTSESSQDAARSPNEDGAMSRRLAEMAEETIDTGSKSDRKLMREVGFSEELKKQLEDRIADTGFAAEKQRAASEINMPVCLNILPPSSIHLVAID